MSNSTAAVHTISYVDYALLGILCLSIIIGLWRGFVKEALSLAAWGAAVWVSIMYTGDLADIFANKIHNPSARYILSFVLLFFVTLMLGALVNHLISVSGIVKKTGLSGTDRLLGVGFGVVRGIVIIGILILLGEFTHFPEQDWWTHSSLIPRFQVVVDQFHRYLPQLHDVITS